MLRKTLIALTAVGALGVSSAAIAAQGGWRGGSGPAMRGGGSPSGMRASPSVMRASPTMRTAGTWSGSSTLRTANWQGGTWRGSNWRGSTWRTANWQGRHHHRFRNNAFLVGVGFGAGFYGGYDSCWRLVPTYWGGWQRVWVCDYPYYGGYGDYWGY